MKSEFVRIEQGNIARRILAVIMDAVLTVFIFIGLATLVFTPIANKAFHYGDIEASQYRYQIATQLYVVYETDEEGNVKKDSVQDLNRKVSDDSKIIMLFEYEPEGVKESTLISFYKTRVQYYYCNYRIGNNIVVPKGAKNVADFRAPNYKDYLKEKTVSEWETWFNKKVWKDVKKLDDAKQIALKATEDFYYSNYYQEANKTLENIQLFIILPSYVLSFSIFFIVIPLCFKNGETLAKKTLHIGILSKDGYSVKKRQIILRQVALLLYCGLFTFIIGIGLTSIATLFIGVFIYFLATFISKSKRSPLDYLAFTIVVDTKKSVWYKDEFEETSMTKEFDDNMKKYRKEPVQSKNVIQVGSEIIDVEIKKEIIDSKDQEK